MDNPGIQVYPKITDKDMMHPDDPNKYNYLRDDIYAPPRPKGSPYVANGYPPQQPPPPPPREPPVEQPQESKGLFTTMYDNKVIVLIIVFSIIVILIVAYIVFKPAEDEPKPPRHGPPNGPPTGPPTGPYGPPLPPPPHNYGGGTQPPAKKKPTRERLKNIKNALREQEAPPENKKSTRRRTQQAADDYDDGYAEQVDEPVAEVMTADDQINQNKSYNNITDIVDRDYLESTWDVGLDDQEEQEEQQTEVKKCSAIGKKGPCNNKAIVGDKCKVHANK